MIEKIYEIMERNSRWKHDINYTKDPMKYVYSSGLGGMYVCKPYKQVLMGMLKFINPEAARISAESIYNQFLSYLESRDFVGADLSRKYLQACSSKKSVPKVSREIFRHYYDLAMKSERYKDMISEFKQLQAIHKKKKKEERDNASWRFS